MSEYSKEYYLKNKSRILNNSRINSARYYKSKEWRIKQLEIRKIRFNKQKIEAFHSLGDVCIKCGFSDKRALQIDHINGDGSKKLSTSLRSTGAQFYKNVYISVKNNEHRFQILCANCNWIKRFENNEIHISKREPFVNKICIENKQESTLFSL